jgi:ubiquinone/menaquinone biosynthesis C-methylase UbiE
MLKDLGIKPEQCVLDFGCGPGGFSFAASRLVSSTWRVYALDINSFAIDKLIRYFAAWTVK